MESNNSQEQFELALSLACYGDVASYSVDSQGTCLCDKRSRDRDELEIRRRFKHEGMGFLTITLPSYGRALDKALATDTPLHIEGLEIDPDTNLPKFLGRLWERVFDATRHEIPYVRPLTEEEEAAGIVATPVLATVDGTYKGITYADNWYRAESVRLLRQFLYLFYRYELPCSKSLHDATIHSFKEVDIEIGVKPDLNKRDNDWLLLARKFIKRVFCNFDPTDIVPRHGPGAVATGERPWEKPRFKRWYSCLAAVYHYEEYFHYNLSHLCDELGHYLSLEEHTVGTAKVVLVPKDSRGPRLISCEPLEYQWIQQGLGRALMAWLESHPYTRKFVNFTNQEVNRELAMRASRTPQSWVTLDMKDASDRVSMWLVEDLFWDVPLLGALYAARTAFTRLPDGETVPLNKFAPMGSALCFPVEAIVFYALCVAAIRTRYPQYTWQEACECVYVYGDDIICRFQVHEAILAYLPKVKLKFNQNKCCTGRSFRESCGMDAYEGVNVTPTKIRTVWCHQPRPESFLSYCSYQNSFYKNGFYRTAKFLEERIKALYKVPYKDPSQDGFVGLCSMDVCRNDRYKGFRTRFNPRTQKHEIRCLGPRSGIKTINELSWCEMLRVSSQRSLHTVAGEYPLINRINLKLIWCSTE